MTEFKKKFELDQHQVIAMQIRRGTKETSFVEIATEQQENIFWSCALKMAQSDKVFHLCVCNIVWLVRTC